MSRPGSSSRTTGPSNSSAMPSVAHSREQMFAEENAAPPPWRERGRADWPDRAGGRGGHGPSRGHARDAATGGELGERRRREEGCSGSAVPVGRISSLPPTRPGRGPGGPGCRRSAQGRPGRGRRCRGRLRRRGQICSVSEQIARPPAGPGRDPESVRVRMDAPLVTDQGGVGTGREREKGGSILYGCRPEPPLSSHRASRVSRPPGANRRPWPRLPHLAPEAGSLGQDRKARSTRMAARRPSSCRRGPWIERADRRRLPGFSVTPGPGDCIRATARYLGLLGWREGCDSEARRSSTVRVGERRHPGRKRNGPGQSMYLGSLIVSH